MFFCNLLNRWAIGDLYDSSISVYSLLTGFNLLAPYHTNHRLVCGQTVFLEQTMTAGRCISFPSPSPVTPLLASPLPPRTPFRLLRVWIYDGTHPIKIRGHTRQNTPSLQATTANGLALSTGHDLAVVFLLKLITWNKPFSFEMHRENTFHTFLKI